MDTVLPPDVEKSPELLMSTSVQPPIPESNTYAKGKKSLFSTLRHVNSEIESLSTLEARGISRVPAEERHLPSRWNDVSVALLWFSANISVNNLAVGLLGPLVFQLGFLDCAMCAVFGAFLGSVSTGYMSIWGPLSGNRTMVCVFSNIIIVVSSADKILRLFSGILWGTGQPRFPRSLTLCSWYVKERYVVGISFVLRLTWVIWY